MSVRFDTVNEYLSRTTNLPPLATFTMMAWIYMTVDRDTDSQVFVIGGSAYPWYQVGFDGTGTGLASIGADGQIIGSTLSVGVWYHVAVTINTNASAQYVVYLNGVSNFTNTGDPTILQQEMRFGTNSDGEWFNGRMAAIKVWDVALSAAEILNEMRQVMPVKTDSLNSFYPCQTGSDFGTDYSGNARAATVTGTVSLEDGPPIPWRQGRHRRVYIAAAGATVKPAAYYLTRMSA